MSPERKYFDYIAGDYINTWVKSKKKAARVRRITSGFGLKKGMAVLEAGAGNGQFTPFILERTGKKGKIHLVDYSEKMLKIAKKNLKNYPVKMSKSDVAELPVKNRPYDMVLCFNSFPHFYPKEKTLKEFHRVLKKNGKLVVAHTARASYINNMHAKYGFDMKKHYLPLKKEMQKLTDKTGFKIVSYYNKNYYLLKAVKIQRGF